MRHTDPLAYIVAAGLGISILAIVFCLGLFFGSFIFGDCDCCDEDDYDDEDDISPEDEEELDREIDEEEAEIDAALERYHRYQPSA
jgi:hypothetical protein